MTGNKKKHGFGISQAIFKPGDPKEFSVHCGHLGNQTIKNPPGLVQPGIVFSNNHASPSPNRKEIIFTFDARKESAGPEGARTGDLTITVTFEENTVPTTETMVVEGIELLP
jgi:hypothetical protein